MTEWWDGFISGIVLCVIFDLAIIFMVAFAKELKRGINN